MIKTKNVKVIDVSDWDQLVMDTYGIPYCFQQQDDCKPRGSFNLSIPSKYSCDDEMNNSIPEIINGDKMGVKFDVWLKRDPKQPLNPSKEELKECSYYWGKTEEEEIAWKESASHISMFYDRNFYPDIYTLANDLHKKGLIEEGDYSIDIDW